MQIETIRELSGYKGSAVLVRGEDGRYFVVSSVTPIIGGPETLVLPADAEGEVTDWLEVAGGRAYSREEAIADLAENYPTEGSDDE